ncbi:hypothetical protein C7M84_021923, partial [Penaeus vannamei]
MAGALPRRTPLLSSENPDFGCRMPLPDRTPLCSLREPRLRMPDALRTEHLFALSDEPDFDADRLSDRTHLLCLSENARLRNAGNASPDEHSLSLREPDSECLSPTLPDRTPLCSRQRTTSLPGGKLPLSREPNTSLALSENPTSDASPDRTPLCYLEENTIRCGCPLPDRTTSLLTLREPDFGSHPRPNTSLLSQRTDSMLSPDRTPLCLSQRTDFGCRMSLPDRNTLCSSENPTSDAGALPDRTPLCSLREPPTSDAGCLSRDEHLFALLREPRLGCLSPPEQTSCSLREPRPMRQPLCSSEKPRLRMEDASLDEHLFASLREPASDGRCSPPTEHLFALSEKPRLRCRMPLPDRHLFALSENHGCLSRPNTLCSLREPRLGCRSLSRPNTSLLSQRTRFGLPDASPRRTPLALSENPTSRCLSPTLPRTPLCSLREPNFDAGCSPRHEPLFAPSENPTSDADSLPRRTNSLLSQRTPTSDASPNSTEHLFALSENRLSDAGCISPTEHILLSQRTRLGCLSDRTSLLPQRTRTPDPLPDRTPLCSPQKNPTSDAGCSPPTDLCSSENPDSDALPTEHLFALSENPDSGCLSPTEHLFALSENPDFGCRMPLPERNTSFALSENPTSDAGCSPDRTHLCSLREPRLRMPDASPRPNTSLLSQRTPTSDASPRHSRRTPLCSLREPRLRMPTFPGRTPLCSLREPRLRMPLPDRTPLCSLREPRLRMPDASPRPNTSLLSQRTRLSDASPRTNLFALSENPDFGCPDLSPTEHLFAALREPRLRMPAPTERLPQRTRLSLFTSLLLQRTRLRMPLPDERIFAPSENPDFGCLSDEQSLALQRTPTSGCSPRPNTSLLSQRPRLWDADASPDRTPLALFREPDFGCSPRREQPLCSQRRPTWRDALRPNTSLLSQRTRDSDALPTPNRLCSLRERHAADCLYRPKQHLLLTQRTPDFGCGLPLPDRSTSCSSENPDSRMLRPRPPLCCFRTPIRMLSRLSPTDNCLPSEIPDFGCRNASPDEHLFALSENPIGMRMTSSRPEQPLCYSQRTRSRNALRPKPLCSLREPDFGCSPASPPTEHSLCSLKRTATSDAGCLSPTKPLCSLREPDFGCGCLSDSPTEHALALSRTPTSEICPGKLLPTLPDRYTLCSSENPGLGCLSPTGALFALSKNPDFDVFPDTPTNTDTQPERSH